MRKIISLVILAAVIVSLFSACSIIKVPYQNVFIVPNTVKYTRDESVPPTETDTLSATMAKNEKEGVQFVLNFPEDVDGVHIDVSDVTDSNGNKLGLFGYYREYYTFSCGYYYPDALIPLEYDDLNDFSITAGQNQGIWITFMSDKEQPAGLYTGSVSVTYDGGEITLPVEVTVWDFAIPTRPSMQSSFEMWFGTVWTHMTQLDATEGENYTELHKQYYDFMLDYRVCPNSFPESYSTVEQYADLVEKYLADERVPNYRIPMEQYCYDENGLKQNWRNYIDILDERGLLDRGFVYTFDEPSVGLYGDLTASFNAITDYNPDVRCLLTVSSRRSLFGAPNVWCGVWNTTNNFEPFVRDRQEAGDEVWWYECATTCSAEPSYHIPEEMCSPRIISWMQKDFNITGQLTWATCISTMYTDELGWNTYRDIFDDPTTIYGTVGGGYIFYGGSKNDGVVNRNIPVPSLRLESIRDGMEDYEYLCLIQKKYEDIIDKYDLDIDVDAVMDTYYDSVYNAVADFDSDPSAMTDTREIIAHDLLASDEVIVTSRVAMTHENTDMREVLVYAPSGSTVTINGTLAEEKNIGKCSEWSAVLPMQGNRVLQYTEISVDGENYTRILRGIDEEEIRETAYLCLKEDCEALGIDYITARKNFEQNNYEFATEDDFSQALNQVVRITHIPELLPTLKLGLCDDLTNTIPLCVTTEAVVTEKSDDMIQKLNIYVPADATVRVNGNAATLVETNENHSLYSYEIAFESAGRHLVSFEVTSGGVTETTARVIYQETDKMVNLFDLTNPDVVAAIESDPDYKVKDNGITLHFDTTTRNSSTAWLDVDDMNGVTSLDGYTHIVYDFTNNSSSFIFPYVPNIIVSGMRSPCKLVYGALAPGDTIRIYAQIPNEIFGEFGGIRFVTTDYAPTVSDVKISNVRLCNIPYYYRGDSDYVILLGE